MGATSVTGVSGKGAAVPTRGPGNNRNQYVSLLDPHIVYSGNITFESSEGPDFRTVDIPSDIKDIPENLTLVVAGKAYVITKNLDSDGLVESFLVIGSKKSNVDFVVIKSTNEKFATVLSAGP
jgi:hypothetical protein